MSSLSQIRIFYGIGEIVHGPSGVDFSLFPDITVRHPNPDGANIRDLKDWFVALFQMDAIYIWSGFNAYILETYIS
jgi:hypothetical protein